LKAKGPLNERTALVPASWVSAALLPKKPLIEEISPSTSTSKSSIGNTVREDESSWRSMSSKVPLAPPKWSFEIENTDNGTTSRSARIAVQIPLLVSAPNDPTVRFNLEVLFFPKKKAKEDHSNTSLDLERNRLLLDCKPKYALLDIPVLTDGNSVLGLDIDKAKAEWNIRRGLLVISAPIVTQ
jgi:hypothetical protein